MHLKRLLYMWRMAIRLAVHRNRNHIFESPSRVSKAIRFEAAHTSTCAHSENRRLDQMPSEDEENKSVFYGKEIEQIFMDLI